MHLLGHSTRALTTVSKGESYKRLITTKAIDQAFNWIMRIVMMRFMGMIFKAVMVTMKMALIIMNNSNKV